MYLAYARRRSADPRFISGTRMRGHCRLPMARSTAPFRCSCCHSLPISSMLSLRCAAWSGPAGQVTAAVWDQFGGMPVFPLLRDTAAALARTAERPRALFSSLTAPGEMSAMCHQPARPGRADQPDHPYGFHRFRRLLAAVTIPRRPNGVVPGGPLGRGARDVVGACVARLSVQPPRGTALVCGHSLGVSWNRADLESAPCCAASCNYP